MCYTVFMQIFMLILAVGFLGVIVYFAISPKSSRLVKIVAISALVLAGLTIGICAFFLLSGPAQDPDAIPLPVFQDMPTEPAKKSNVMSFFIFFAFLFAILGVIIYVAVRDRKKTQEPVKKKASSSVFMDNDDLDIGLGGGNARSSVTSDLDDSFDIDIE